MVQADHKSNPNFNLELCARVREPRVNVNIVRKKPSKKPQARFDSFAAFDHNKRTLADTTNCGEMGSAYMDDNEQGDPSNDIHNHMVDQGDDQEEDNVDAVSDASSAASESSDDEGNDENGQVECMAQV